MTVLLVSSLFFLLTFNPLFYSLLLVLVLFIVVFTLSFYSLIPSLLGLVLILVYLGSIIIMLSYVCAVIPNVFYAFTPNSFTTLFSAITLLFLIFYTTLSPIVPSSTPLLFTLSSFFYSPIGGNIFVVVALFILLVMFSTSSTVNVAAPFRSHFGS